MKLKDIENISPDSHHWSSIPAEETSPVLKMIEESKNLKTNMHPFIYAYMRSTSIQQRCKNVTVHLPVLNAVQIFRMF